MVGFGQRAIECLAGRELARYFDVRAWSITDLVTTAPRSASEFAQALDARGIEASADVVGAAHEEVAR